MDELAKYQEPLAREYETLSRDELKQRLQLFIGDLLEHNFEKLCHMIYRHDVEESKFHLAMQEPAIEKQSAAIADLVIERELQKVASRKAYQKEKKKSLE